MGGSVSGQIFDIVLNLSRKKSKLSDFNEHPITFPLAFYTPHPPPPP